MGKTKVNSLYESPKKKSKKSKKKKKSKSEKQRAKKYVDSKLPKILPVEYPAYQSIQINPILDYPAINMYYDLSRLRDVTKITPVYEPITIPIDTQIAQKKKILVDLQNKIEDAKEQLKPDILSREINITTLLIFYNVILNILQDNFNKLDDVWQKINTLLKNIEKPPHITYQEINPSSNLIRLVNALQMVYEKFTDGNILSKPIFLPNISHRMAQLTNQLKSLQPFNITKDIILPKSEKNDKFISNIIRTIIRMMELIDDPYKIMNIENVPLEEYIRTNFIR